MVKQKNPPLFLELIATLGGLKVREKFIAASKKEQAVYGQSFGRTEIEVNPVVCLVDTIIHETLHTMRPDWSERTIQTQTTKLLNKLSEPEMREIYRVYRSRLKQAS